MQDKHLIWANEMKSGLWAELSGHLHPIRNMFKKKHQFLWNHFLEKNENVVEVHCLQSGNEERICSSWTDAFELSSGLSA